MKKIGSISLVFIMIIAIFTGCSSSKTTVTIKMDVNGEVTTKEIKTDKITLEDLLVEKADELKITLSDSDYGKFITGINSYVADETANEFIEVIVNNESSMVGIKEITITDKDVYTLKVSKF